MVTLSTMQVILLGVFLTTASLVKSQIWNDPNNGIMVKTFYWPLRKGSQSISLQDINRGGPLTAVNIPYLPVKVNADLQQASTLNQNYHPKVKLYETDVQTPVQLQDQRPKVNSLPLKPESQSHVSNPHDSFQGSTFQPQQFTVLQQPATNFAGHNVVPSHQFRQSQFLPNHVNIHPQNFIYPKNFTNNQHHDSAVTNSNFGSQNAHSSTTGVGISNSHNQRNFGQQVYSANNFVAPVHNYAHSELHNDQNQQSQYSKNSNQEIHQNAQTLHNDQNQQSQYSKNPNQEIHQNAQTLHNDQNQQSQYSKNPNQEIHQNAQTLHNDQNQQSQYSKNLNQEIHQNAQAFSGESSRYFHQIQSNLNPTHPATYATSPVQHVLYPNNHQPSNYGTQIPEGNLHEEPVVNNNNPYQIQQFQENKHIQIAPNQQLQHPVNNFAVVHQRNQENNYAVQDNRASVHSEQPPPLNFKQFSVASPASSYALYNHNGPTISPSQDTSFPMTSQIHPTGELPHNSVENMHYSVKQVATGPIDNHQYSGHNQQYNVNPQIQAAVPQYQLGQHGSSEGQYGSSEGQYVNQQSSGYTLIQNHDSKSRVPQQQQNQASQASYPDPTSETFYPENKQIYVAPPPDYSTQIPQRIGSENNFARHPLQSDNNIHNSQVPLSMQTEQTGVHISVPNRNLVLRDSTTWSKYGNAYK